MATSQYVSMDSDHPLRAERRVEWVARRHPGPLSGLRVVDLGTMIAGPFATTLFADYGADVIKVEKPGTGDPIREWSPFKEGKSLWWKVTARNKRLITLDLSRPEGQTLLRDLASVADVVVENFRPGTLERWGLDYDALSERNPCLVLVRVSGYGQTGPLRGRPGYGTVADAMSGIPAFTGLPDGPPTLPAFPLADVLAGTFGALGALAVLQHRHATGRGGEVDVSLFEPLFRMVESQVIGYDQLELVKQRVGNRLEEDSPRNAYATRDRKWIAISASSDRTFARLTQAIDRPELSADARFASNAARIANADELDALIRDWIIERDSQDVLERFETHDVVAGAVFDIRDIFRDPQYLARDAIVEVPDQDFGSVRMQGVVPRFPSMDGVVRHTGAALGADNNDVLREIMGLDGSAIAALRERGVSG